MAELVDAHGSGPCAARCGGSSPSVGTKTKRSVDENQPAFCVLGRTSKAPARFAGGTRKSGLARPDGVAGRDRGPPCAANKKGRMMKIIRPFAFWGSNKKFALLPTLIANSHSPRQSRFTAIACELARAKSFIIRTVCLWQRHAPASAHPAKHRQLSPRRNAPIRQVPGLVPP